MIDQERGLRAREPEECQSTARGLAPEAEAPSCLDCDEGLHAGYEGKL